MNTSCISRSRTSITRAPRPRAHRRMASVNASNKTALNEFYRVAYRKGIVQQTSSRPIWTHGSKNAMWRGHIRDVGASVRPPMQIFLDAMPTTKEKMIAA